MSSILNTNTLVRLLHEITLIGFAICLTLVASFLIAPIRQNSLLYCHQTPNAISTSNMSQLGWPLPFESSYTVETTAKTMPTNVIDFAAAIVDVGLLYIVIRLAVFVITRVRGR